MQCDQYQANVHMFVIHVSNFTIIVRVHLFVQLH
jgi:hypothetical protein